MIITSIAGNLAELSDAERQELDVDFAVFDNESRLKRVQRVTTEGGAEIALRLDRDVRELADGDILLRDGDKVVAVKIAPTDVLVIAPKDIREALVTAHTLGNRHLQAQFFGAESEFGEPVMVVRYDHTVEHYLDHAGVSYRRGEHVMPEAFRHAEHSH
ncbi:Urease accessory protein UreE [Corynebacterium atypicum]|uniref:Urease accessory protein UreE n=1 Tax=Corynebacterium atypicum TaxID=191610 RepID=A0ABN4DEF8_9CORY|nr:urease accessory protein UreE [Corynebacterium atypicum]AIG64681.1 Urease accessory protein UreE [Corynebacterium atypicum]